MAKTYIAIKTGNVLEARPRMFFWRGRYFSGLVDVEANSLYDNPEDSFAQHVGLDLSVVSGQIREQGPTQAPSGL